MAVADQAEREVAKVAKQVRAGSKELCALARRLRPGLILVSDGKAKVVILDADGKPLRYADGRPVGMPNSPCSRTVKDVEKRLRSVGALAQ